jgi:hypothetical protein
MLLFSLFYSAFAQSSQSLVYDLSFKGQPVGVREITIQYLPASDNMPHGSRILESWTEVETTVAGKKIVYKQRATGHFSDRKSRFVSVVTVNDQHFELQGKQEQGEGWIIHEITSGGVTSTEYKHYEVSDISLALFDPGQSTSWQDGTLTKIYHIEMGEIWMGEWIELAEVQVSTPKETVTGKQYRYHSPDGEVDAAWSETGIVIDWTLRVLGLELEADIRNVPELPQFGNIEQFESFQGVKEEEL